MAAFGRALRGTARDGPAVAAALPRVVAGLRGADVVLADARVARDAAGLLAAAAVRLVALVAAALLTAAFFFAVVLLRVALPVATGLAVARALVTDGVAVSPGRVRDFDVAKRIRPAAWTRLERRAASIGTIPRRVRTQAQAML
ncbi:MAG: hypothetical protein IT477_04235 [Rhodanobacteraceae bacterium]|nr:hypothetical protein [Rhodanobacteraceae bacterium]